VRTLGLVGGDAFVALLHDLDFAAASESGDYYGPALALGGADVTLLELVGAYRMLANGGGWSPLRVTPAAVGRLRPAPRRALSRHRRPPPRGRVLPGHPLPRPPQAPPPPLRPREPAPAPLLHRREDRHEQGHARQLVPRVLRALHGRRLGRQRLGRAHARRER